MRIIADENISWRLKKLLPLWDILPVNEIKTDLKLSDAVIWQFAKSNNYTILTFDEDFTELQNLLSYPPKIIWLRTGNLSTIEISAVLLKREDGIKQFLVDQDAGVYEIH